MEFTENQKFNQPLLWALILGALAILSFSISNSGASVARLTALAVIVAIALLFLVVRLKTTINNEGITFQYFPFFKKNVPWNQIQQCSTINYGFVGGWGIRFTSKYGTVYNVKGNQGIFLKLVSGKKMVIGTQKTADVNKVLIRLDKTPTST